MNENLEFECKVKNDVPIQVASDTIRVTKSDIFGLETINLYYEKCQPQYLDFVLTTKDKTEMFKGNSKIIRVK